MAKKVLFGVIALGIMLAILETFAWVTVQVVDRDDLFDHRQGVLSLLSAKGLARYVANGGDPVLGWHIAAPMVHHEDDCRGTPKTFTYTASGERAYTGYDPDNVAIITVGNSYTDGGEADDDDTYPAQLAELLGVSVANHGVSGYGPTQAFLALQQRAALHPEARIVILGIMYENTYRMVNSYRPVLYKTSSTYTLKPYMAGGALQPHPGEAAFADVESFKRYANAAFDHDFWAKPEARFPYSLALAQALTSNYFYLRKLQKLLREVGLSEYALTFRHDEIRLDLISLLNSLADFVLERGMQPVVVFIPRNLLDTESATEFIERNRDQMRPQLVLGDVGQAADIDWQQFNLREKEGDDICHPSAYGYRMIAEYVAELLKANSLVPAS